MDHAPEEGIEAAISCALIAHTRQTDKNGEPYILHPLRVMLKVKESGLSEAAQMAAVLHDVVEDTEVTLEQIRTIFGERVASLVDNLTKREGEEYRDYLERVRSDFSARAIKMADIADNMDPERIIDKHSLYSRYARAYRYLKHNGENPF